MAGGTDRSIRICVERVQNGSELLSGSGQGTLQRVGQYRRRRWRFISAATGDTQYVATQPCYQQRGLHCRRP